MILCFLALNILFLLFMLYKCSCHMKHMIKLDKQITELYDARSVDDIKRVSERQHNLD